MSNRRKSDKSVKRKLKGKERIILIVSIVLGVILLLTMILNIPIIAVERNKDGRTFTEHISIIRWIKELQPLVNKEGNLSSDTNSYALKDDAESSINDNRDFTNDQIIEGQFTVLCLGFDESRSNSDVMMLFLFDIINKEINILQIPRDSYVPDLTSSATGKINSVYTLGDQDLIPIQRTVNAVRDTFGIPIDRYITTGCDDIVDMVDLIGGIPINIPEKIVYSSNRIIYPGEQVLNGTQAEWFVRFRKGYSEGDIGRVKAQRIFLAAAMEKALDMGSIDLMKFLTQVYNKGYIGTDMTLQEMSILSDFGSNIDMDNVNVHMVPGEGTYTTDGVYSVWSIHKDPTVDLLNEYFRPYQKELNYDELDITELIDSNNYKTDIYDNTKDTLQDIAEGVKPGVSKKDLDDSSISDSSSYESASDRSYIGGGY